MNCLNKKKAMLLCLLFLTTTIVLGWSTTSKATSEYPITFIDDVGKEITITGPAQRIISLYSAHTENLFSLGLDEEIIGVGRVDIYPPKTLEKKRYDYRSDPEKTIAAEPDLVIIRPFIKRSHPEFIDALEKAGLHVVALYPDTFEKFDEYIKKLAILTGKEEKAEELLKNFHQEIRDIQTLTKDTTPKMNVYFESVEKGYKTVTPDSMPARAIEIAGGINIAKDALPIRKGSSIAAYGVERILEHADKIDVYFSQQGAMHAGGSAHSISIRPGFYAIKAVKNERVHVINEKIISSPTFRYVKGIRELARTFYPEIVDDISKFKIPEAMTREKMAEVVVRFKHKPLFVPTSRYYRKKHKGHTYGTFKDIDIENPYFDFIETAVLSGYMQGMKEGGNEMFYPDKTVTKDEFARILFMLHDFQKTEDHVTINDLERVSKPRIIQIIVDNGIMTCENNYFQPQKVVTGKEAVEILEKLREL
jgi:iron complex transport system substrate-binding protein